MSHHQHGENGCRGQLGDPEEGVAHLIVDRFILLRVDAADRKRRHARFRVRVGDRGEEVPKAKMYEVGGLRIYWFDPGVVFGKFSFEEGIGEAFRLPPPTGVPDIRRSKVRSPLKSL